MEYRAVRNRCAIILDSLHLPISREKALTILSHKGFSVVNVDMVTLARQCIGTVKYHRGARSSEAPAIVDCSSFIKWLYAKRGIWLPRRSVQQRELGEPVCRDEIIADDVVFVSGRINYYHDDPANGVGHVGLATDEETVIHAASERTGVIESPLDKFIGMTKFRGARRYLPKGIEVLTLETTGQDVETADDLRWIVLQSLSKG